MNLWHRYSRTAWFADGNQQFRTSDVYVGRVCDYNRINWHRVLIPHGGAVTEYSTNPIIRHFDQETPQMRECGMRGAP